MRLGARAADAAGPDDVGPRVQALILFIGMEFGFPGACRVLFGNAGGWPSIPVRPASVACQKVCPAASIHPKFCKLPRGGIVEIITGAFRASVVATARRGATSRRPEEL